MFSRVFHRIRECVGFGLGLGTLFSLWVAFLALIQLSTTITTRSGRELNVFAVIAIYLLGGAVGGVIVGILLPLTRWAVGAAFVGALAALPFGFGVVVTLMEGSPWTLDHTIVWLIGSVALGGSVGVGYRRLFREEDGEEKGRRTRRRRRK